MVTEVVVQRTGLEGQGVAFDGAGNIYFVPGVIPGDRIRVEFSPTQKRYRDAVFLELLEASPQRQDPGCAYFQDCGGCDWLHWDYAGQLLAKESVLKHVLQRSALTPHEFLPMLRSPDIYGYRNRIQLRRKAGKVGFFRRKTHEIVDVERCRVAHPKLNEEIAHIRTEKPPARSEGDDDGEKIELMVNGDNSVARVYNSPHGILGFRQVNSGQNEALREMLRSHLVASQSRLILELFCGNGNLTFAFAGEVGVEKVLGIDSSYQAIEQANARRAETGRSNIQFLTSEIRPATSEKLPAAFKGRYDTLVLDPPRQGAGNSLEFFVHPNLKNIFYISCSPLTFTQDVKFLNDQGFAFVLIQPVDMFPHTRHIELFAKFSRP